MTNVNEDLIEDSLDTLTKVRFNRNQEIRQMVVDYLTEDIRATMVDPDKVNLLLSTLRDIDNSDHKRLAIKQEEKTIDSRERVLSILTQIRKVTTGNPYQVDTPVNREIEKPAHYYEQNDFTEQELSIHDNPGSYKEFMEKRESIRNKNSE